MDLAAAVALSAVVELFTCRHSLSLSTLSLRWSQSLPPSFSLPLRSRSRSALSPLPSASLLHPHLSSACAGSAAAARAACTRRRPPVEPLGSSGPASGVSVSGKARNILFGKMGCRSRMIAPRYCSYVWVGWCKMIRCGTP